MMAPLCLPCPIKALDEESLEHLVMSLGYEKYRSHQLIRWLYQKGVSSYAEMSDLPDGLLAALAQSAPLTTPKIIRTDISPSDLCRKYLLALHDGVTIESVGIPDGRRLTVCISTQAGCPLGCTFCATGRAGFVRDLSVGEIVDQANVVARDFDRRVTNVVLMGQGEPFLNYDSCMVALRFINSSFGIGIGARHITVSTVGLLDGIRRFAEEPGQYTLAISLHSAVQKTRDQLMPGVRQHTLPELRAALEEYTTRTGRRVSLEYAFISSENDSDSQLRSLIDFCSGLLCHVNLMACNPGPTHAERLSSQRLAIFKTALRRAGIPATIRVSRGSDINAACGQLSQTHRSGG